MGYDGLGQRVKQTVAGVVTQYLLDVQPGLAVVLADTTGANTNRYVHGPRGIHAQKDSGNAWEYMMQDGLGSVRQVTNSSGGVLESRLRDPFGNPVSSSGMAQTSYGFTGEWTDSNALLYLRARYYNPALGVFMSRDPFEGSPMRIMSMNGYGWVEGNSINITDPIGLVAGNSCGAWASVFDPAETGPDTRPGVAEYQNVVRRDQNAYLAVASRRLAELKGWLNNPGTTAQMMLASSNRECALSSGLVPSSILNLLPHNITNMFNSMSEHEFASRMAATFVAVNVAGWWEDWTASFDLNNQDTWTQQLVLLQHQATNGYILGNRVIEAFGFSVDLWDEHSAGFFELRYSEFLRLTNPTSYSFGNVSIAIQGITDISSTWSTTIYGIGNTTFSINSSTSCTNDPWECFLNYIVSHPQDYISGGDQTLLSSTGLTTTSSLAEVAGARLLEMYLQYFSMWAQNPNRSNWDPQQLWSSADPHAYALYCSRSGGVCDQMNSNTPGISSYGWGSQTDFTISIYERHLMYFRALFGSSNSECLVSCSEVSAACAQLP